MLGRIQRFGSTSKRYTMPVVVRVLLAANVNAEEMEKGTKDIVAGHSQPPGTDRGI